MSASGSILVRRVDALDSFDAGLRQEAGGTAGNGSMTPIMLSRVTSLASAISFNPSVPFGLRGYRLCCRESALPHHPAGPDRIPASQHADCLPPVDDS